MIRQRQAILHRLHRGHPGYIVVYNDNDTYRYLVSRRFGRHFTPLRPVSPHLRGYGWTTNPNRATIYGWYEPAQTRAARFARRGAWVEPADHLIPLSPPKEPTMTTYNMGRGVKLRTSAARRYLIVSVYDGRAKVEASTDDQDAAAALVARYRREFGPGAKLTLIDQTGRWD